MSRRRLSRRNFGQLAKPRHIVPLVGAVLAAAALLGSTASSASAAPVGFFIGGEKSEEASKQPKFEAEKYSASISATSLTTFVFTAQAGKYQCSNVEYEGTAPLAAASSTLPLWSRFLQCTFVNLATELRPNGCGWALNTLNAGPPYVGTMDVVCPAGKAWEIAVSSGGFSCTLSIPAQKGLEGVSYENTGSGSARAVTMSLNLTGVKYSQAGSKFLCPTGEYTNGTYTGSASFTAAQ